MDQNQRGMRYLLQYRDTVKACRIFGLNRYELWMLLALEYWLRWEGMQVGSKTRFFQNLTGNSRLKRKFEGYFYGLLNKGFIGTFEYMGQQPSLCVGISEKGMAAIRMHYEYCDELETRYTTTNASPLSFDESPPAKYRKIA